ncbi:unnamed protein product [Microthlaspi erraticum]|uniref:Uncharacterized protein n=1 Tax=Microthlaspi erraticum TaxID=1685480 RepID=A0A6D2I529_9BRAS|nr:unnamed protein product [Microthlaspi erraticum]
MDFIKTSSLRALSELTFQRNWNGLIWMSRKGVMTKRVKTGPDGSIEHRANRAHRPIEERTYRDRPSHIIASRQVHGRAHVPTREATSRGRPRLATTSRARPRARGSNASRPRNSVRGRSIRPTRKARPTSGRRIIGQISSVRPRGRTRKSRPRSFRLDSRPRPDSRPIVPTDRPNAAVDPKPVLKPVSHVFTARLNPKPPLKT